MQQQEKKRGRFAIEWRARMQTWVGRVRELDGKRSRWYSLQTDNQTLAEQRYSRWLETGDPPAQSGREKFKDAAERVAEAQVKGGEKNAKDRQSRLRKYAVPVIGEVEVAQLAHHHVASVLDSMVPHGLASATILGMRVDISSVLSQLCREGAIPFNCALGVPLPKNASDNDDDREHVQLTDEEILQFQKERGFERELDVMVLHARQLAGHRTSCLHAEDWSDWDTVHWKTVKVRRPKTDDGRRRERAGRKRGRRAYEKVLHVIPSVVVGPTQAWWHRQGCPKKGPVFPVRKGPKAGERKGDNISYAKAFRKAAWEAGLRRPFDDRFHTATGDERKLYCALQTATDDSLPLDFHSLRRAFITACAAAGMTLQDSMDASGHTVASTHHGYRGPRLLAVPAAAIPGEPENKGLPPSGFSPDAPAAPDPMAAMTALLAAAMKQAMAGVPAPPPPAPVETGTTTQKPAQTHVLGLERAVAKLRIVGRKGGA